MVSAGELPSGTITLLFTDIEGSTLLVQLLGDRYGALLADHRRLLRTAFADHAGHEIDTQGDAFFVAFASAKDAVAAAVDAQIALAGHAWPGGAHVRVRMGLHSGEPALGEEGYHGLGLHRGARICSAGHGGQILLSNATRELIADERIDGIELLDLGEKRLKDIERSERITQVVYPGMPALFPPLKTVDAQPPDAPFEGREEALAAAVVSRFGWVRPPRSRGLAIAAAVVVLGVAGAVFAVLSGNGGHDALASLAENTVGRIDPGSAELTAQYPVGDGPHALAAGAGSLWAANTVDGTVTRIDHSGGDVATTTIPVGDDTSGIAFGEGALWVTDRQDRTLAQISPKTNRVVNSIPLRDVPAAVAAAAGAVWIASDADRSVARFDVASGTFSRPVELGAAPAAIAAGGGAIWLASEEGGTVFRIEPREGVVANTITVGEGPVAVAVGEGAVWVANRQGATVSRIDPATDAVTDTIPVGKDPTAVVVGEGAVWVASGGDGAVSRIDPATRRRTRTVAVESSPSALAVADGAVWTAAIAPASSHRGGTLRVETRPYHYDRLEPSTYDLEVDQLMSLMYSGLVSYRRAGGASYGSLVGDLATSVPKPSPDGRTYVFRLRRGIRYSDGAPVKPEDFRVSMENLLRDARKNDLPSFYHRIVGVPACVERPRRCDLSKGIVTDSAAGTITLHLTEPDSELMQALAYMFAYVAPAEHPFGGKRQPPGTGPYKLASFDGRRGARLVRNPRFRVWSQDARPDGAADEIVVHVRPESQVDAQVRAVERGRSDVVIARRIFGSGLSPEEIGAIATRSAGRVYTDASPLLEYMWLSIRDPPFDKLGVRRALNYAVDRDRVAELAGGVNLAQPTCQLVPPGFPAYQPSCPYTTRPGPGGEYNGPDLARANRLIERSGTKGMKVTVWTYGVKRAYGAYFTSLLQRLGYRSTLRVVAPDYGPYAEAVVNPSTHAQIGINAWQADIAVPSNFAFLFLCEGGGPDPVGNRTRHLCDRRIDAQAAAARRATGAESNALWQKLYERIEATAVAVPLVNRREVTLVSDRVGNFQHHPMWGTLLDQLWVR